MNKIQISLISVAVVILILLYLAPKTNSEATSPVFVAEATKTSSNIDTSNIDGKINLAVWYVDSSVEPMKGIMMLRQVLAIDSNNTKALFTLGSFAVKSGQYDKAIERFEKVLTLNSDYIEAYLYLGDIYESKGDKDKAIKYYQKYKSVTTNPSAVAEIDKYIEQLTIN